MPTPAGSRVGHSADQAAEGSLERALKENRPTPGLYWQASINILMEDNPMKTTAETYDELARLESGPSRLGPLLTNWWEHLAAAAHWLPRLAFAGVFLFHGVGKFPDLAGFAGMMGLPVPVALLVALAEMAGGLGILAGPLLRRDWITRLGGLATVPVMIGAIGMVHLGQWSFVASDTHPMGGMEFQVLLLALGLWYLLVGNGADRPGRA